LKNRTDWQKIRKRTIGYHIALGFIVKVPSSVKFFIHSTHPLKTEFTSLPPLNLVNMTYTDDPSHMVTSYHADWWNSPSSAWTTLPTYSDDKTAAFNDWLELANQVHATNHNFTPADNIELSPSLKTSHRDLKIISFLRHRVLDYTLNMGIYFTRIKMI